MRSPQETTRGSGRGVVRATARTTVRIGNPPRRLRRVGSAALGMFAAVNVIAGFAWPPSGLAPGVAAGPAHASATHFRAGPLSRAALGSSASAPTFGVLPVIFMFAAPTSTGEAPLERSVRFGALAVGSVWTAAARFSALVGAPACAVCATLPALPRARRRVGGGPGPC